MDNERLARVIELMEEQLAAREPIEDAAPLAFVNPPECVAMYSEMHGLTLGDLRLVLEAAKTWESVRSLSLLFNGKR